MPEGRFVTVTRGELENWLRAYGEAWTSRDPIKVSLLFSEDASYLCLPQTHPLNEFLLFSALGRQACPKDVMDRSNPGPIEQEV